jgi:hypothetical protein
MTIHQSPPPSVPLDQPKPQPTTASHGVGAGFPHVAGRCPACRGSSLFLAEAGHVTCSRLECPAPWAADNLLHGITEADPDASRRREWVAALRWLSRQVARQSDASDWVAELADQIESGALTPWAQPVTALPAKHSFVPVAGHPDDDECTHRSDGTDGTYCGRPEVEHEPDGGRHASPNCACGENDAGDQYRDPICARLDADTPEPPAPTPPEPRDFYAMHDHGYPVGLRHAHHVENPHSGDVHNPRANDHTGVPVVTQAEATAPTPNPPPAGGPGWDREAILLGFQQIAAAVRADKPIRLDADDLAQLKALLADLDRFAVAFDIRSTQLHDALIEHNAARAKLDSQASGFLDAVNLITAERETARRELADALGDLNAARAEVAEVTGRLRAALDAGQDVPDADLVPLAGTHREALAGAVRANQEQTAEVERVRAELAEMTAERNRLREWNESLLEAGAEVQGEVERLRAELATARGAVAAAGAGWDREAAELVRTREELAEVRRSLARQWAAYHDELTTELATARRDAEMWERAAGDMEARDRHAAADALAMAGTQLAATHHHPAADLVRDLEAQIRAGERPVPGNPEPTPRRSDGQSQTGDAWNPRHDPMCDGRQHPGRSTCDCGASPGNPEPAPAGGEEPEHG